MFDWSKTKNALNDLNASVTALADLFATIQDNATTREIDLSSALSQSFEQATKRNVVRDIQPVFLTDHVKATNVTIIVNELITNAIHLGGGHSGGYEIGVMGAGYHHSWAQISRACVGQTEKLRFRPQNGNSLGLGNRSDDSKSNRDDEIIVELRVPL